jgi:hypothetical protein
LGREVIRLSVLVVLVLVAACARVPSISEPEALAIEVAATSLLSSIDARDVSQAEWPEQLRFLDPEAVRVKPEGLYVVTSSSFVEEAGVFVPRHPAAFSPMVGGDPEYRSLHGHVFSYRIRG